MMKYLYLVVLSSLLGFAIAHSTLNPKPEAARHHEGLQPESPVENRFIAFPMFSAHSQPADQPDPKKEPAEGMEEKRSDDSLAWRLEEASMYFLYRLLRGFAHLYH